MAKFNEIARIDNYLDGLAKVSAWALSLLGAVSILSASSADSYFFNNFQVPKRLTFVLLALLGILYAVIAGLYISKIRIILHRFRNSKVELANAITTHSSIFNMFSFAPKCNLISRLQICIINLIFFSIIYLSMYFYYVDMLPVFYRNLSVKTVLEMIGGVVILVSSIIVMHKWLVKPALAIIRDTAPSKQKGRIVVVRMLGDMIIINFAFGLLVILSVGYSYYS